MKLLRQNFLLRFVFQLSWQLSGQAYVQNISTRGRDSRNDNIKIIKALDVCTKFYLSIYTKEDIFE
jgi:hypothetical protein